jgi:undecaprenyl diphosphate synthase
MNPLTHVAIIMDGNGRWGLKKKKSRNFGHKEGLKSIEEIINISLKSKIKFLTLFVFSADNWKRPKQEVEYLFNLLTKFLIEKINDLNNKNIKLKIIGKKNFSKKLSNLLKNSEKLTKKNKSLQINLALNYSSKSEIVASIKKTITKKLSINEANITKNLYTKNIPDPEILIRTGNTHRLSNFLLWQLSYTEIFFEKKLWPDFNKFDFIKIIKKYKKIKRNFGSIK